MSLVCAATSAFVLTTEGSGTGASWHVRELLTNGDTRSVMGWNGHEASARFYAVQRIAARDNVVAAPVFAAQGSAALEGTMAVLARRDDDGRWSEQTLMSAEGDFGIGALDIVGSRAVIVETGYSPTVETHTVFEGEPDEVVIRGRRAGTVMLLHDDYIEVLPSPDGF